MPLTLESTHTLHTGTQMPSLGYGVYLSERDKCVKSVLKAIEVGYRHVDCAQYYANEDRKSDERVVVYLEPDVMFLTPPSILTVVGEASTLSGVPRESLFLTTKTFYDDSQKTVDEILPGLIESVQKIGKNQGGEKPYVDLFLIHAPTCGPEGRQLLWDAFQEVSVCVVSIPAATGWQLQLKRWLRGTC